MAGLTPSLRHRSDTVASRRNPSSTIRIFSSGVYLRRVALRTLRMKDCVARVRSSACSFLSAVSFSGKVLLPHQESIPGSSRPPFSLLVQDRDPSHFC